MGNSSLSETVHGHIYKELLFNQLRTVSKNYPPANEGFPPFSLFREFVAWIFAAKKDFLFIGHQGSIGYNEVFPLIQANKMWLGMGFTGGAGHFLSPYEDYAVAGDHKKGMIRVSGVTWFTNLEHGRRHQPLILMTMKDNLRYSKHKDLRESGYLKYDNYDAIEVPYSDAIPSDYEGTMGVPVTFLDKYCPEQFEIVGITKTKFKLASKIYPEQVQINKNGSHQRVSKLNDGPVIKLSAPPSNQVYYMVGNECFVQLYTRILIRKKH